MGRYIRAARRRLGPLTYRSKSAIVSATWRPIVYRARHRFMYDRDYYCGPLRAKNAEQAHYFRNMIRPDDMGSAVSYMLGHYGWDEAQARFEDCEDFAAQARVGLEMVRTGDHLPHCTLDIGCGRGELSAYMSAIGLNVVPIDFATCAPAMVRDTYRRFAGMDAPRVINKSMLPAVKEAAKSTGFTDVIMCESIEHMPEGEFWEAWEIIRERLKGGGRAVVCNMKEYWPIPSDGNGWDHIHSISDATYDRMAGGGRTLYRNKSHIAIEF